MVRRASVRAQPANDLPEFEHGDNQDEQHTDEDVQVLQNFHRIVEEFIPPTQGAIPCFRAY
jgi:hypothetical protein